MLSGQHAESRTHKMGYGGSKVFGLRPVDRTVPEFTYPQNEK